MRPLASMLAWVVLAGCSMLPSHLGYALDCGPMARSECENYAQRVVALAHQQHPGAGVRSIRILDTQGSYDLLFEDGTGISAMT